MRVERITGVQSSPKSKQSNVAKKSSSSPAFGSVFVEISQQSANWIRQFDNVVQTKNLGGLIEKGDLKALRSQLGSNECCIVSKDGYYQIVAKSVDKEMNDVWSDVFESPYIKSNWVPDFNKKQPYKALIRNVVSPDELSEFVKKGWLKAETVIESLNAGYLKDKTKLVQREERVLKTGLTNLDK